MNGQKTIEQKLADFANLLATDPEYAEDFHKMSAEDKAQALLDYGITEAELGSLLANLDIAKEASLAAGKIWAP